MRKPAALLPGMSLQPQQQRVADTGLDDEARLLLYHALGSGKSRSAIGAAETAGEPYTAVMPASLRSNFRKEQEKWTDQKLPSQLYSFNAMARGTGPTETPTLIVDEAQNLRNPASQRTQQVTDLADTAKHLYLLSATPIVNAPHDLAPIVRMLTGREMTPEEFDQRYVGSETKWPGLINWFRGIKPVKLPSIKHRQELLNMLRGHVDYHPPSDLGIDKTEERYEVPMSPEQERLHQGFFDQLPFVLRWKLQHDFPLTKQELRNLSSFLSGPRQVGLSTYPFMRGKQDALKAFQQSPKLQRAMQLVQEGMKSDPNFKAVAFSNFIDAGLLPYQAAMEQAGIPVGMFHGGLSDAQRKQIVNDYNTGKLKALLLGPSGGEGISLKGTRALQLLDPHWNQARLAQAVGRGIRFDSHSDLPEDQRKIRVQRFISRLPMSLGSRMWRWLIQTHPDTEQSNPGTDDYLERMSQRKDNLNEQFLSVLREAGTKTADFAGLARRDSVWQATDPQRKDGLGSQDTATPLPASLFPTTPMKIAIQLPRPTHKRFVPEPPRINSAASVFQQLSQGNNTEFDTADINSNPVPTSKEGAWPELHQTTNLNPMTSAIYQHLTGPGGWFGPQLNKNLAGAPNSFAVANATAPSNLTTPSAAGVGYSPAQAKYNALYDHSYSPGFHATALEGKTSMPGAKLQQNFHRGPAPVPNSVDIDALPPPLQKAGLENIVETQSAKSVKPMLPLPKPTAIMSEHTFTRAMGAQKPPRMSATSKPVGSPAKAFQAVDKNRM